MINAIHSNNGDGVANYCGMNSLCTDDNRANNVMKRLSAAEHSASIRIAVSGYCGLKDVGNVCSLNNVMKRTRSNRAVIGYCGTNGVASSSSNRTNTVTNSLAGSGEMRRYCCSSSIARGKVKGNSKDAANRAARFVGSPRFLTLLNRGFGRSRCSLMGNNCPVLC